MPEDFFGDVWVFSKHLKEPELAYTSLPRLIGWGQRRGKRLFEEIHAVFDSDRLHKEYYEDVSHYMEVIHPAPPVTEYNANLIAAAPELYRECENAKARLESVLANEEAAKAFNNANLDELLNLEIRMAIETIEAALKKARGE
jgi:hypothetical protein